MCRRTISPILWLTGPGPTFAERFRARPTPPTVAFLLEGGEEQVLLDVNQLAEGRDYVSVPMLEVSPDHRILAYAIDFTGREIYEIRFLDLDTGELLPDRVVNTAGSLVWANDGKTFFWLGMDEALRSDRIFRRSLGSEEDEQVFHEPDERFRVALGDTRSRQFVQFVSASSETHEVWLGSLDTPSEAARCVQPRVSGLRYRVTHAGDSLWILTNLALAPHGAQTKAAPNFRLMRTSLDSTSHADWEEVIPHRDSVQIVSVSGFREHLVIAERADGQVQIRSMSIGNGAMAAPIAFPEAVYSVSVSDNPEYDSPWVRVSYESFTTPTSVYRFHLVDHSLELLRQHPVPNYDPSLYTTERRWATAEDGTSVPMSVVYRKDTVLNAETPLFLYGYGSYGITMEPRFSNTRCSLLDRGLVVVFAHIRGGGFLGRRWYEDAKYEGKQHTFSDFIACGRALHGAGVSQPERTVIGGGSAGGLLMGVVVNQAPDLCRAAVAWVPFVDVVTTMLDESIPLTAGEWEEWGDPRQPEPFRWMLAYSPFDNVVAQAYPNMLVVAGLNDPRVQYWEPAKWAAKLRDTATKGEFLLLTHMGAGHAGRSGRYGYLEDAAHDYSYVLDQLAILGD